MVVVAMDERRAARPAGRQTVSRGRRASAVDRTGQLTLTGSVAGPARSATAVRRGPVPQAARDLLADAGRGLGAAIRATEPADRYATAHLAALRGAAAVLAARARPRRGRRASAWDLLVGVAPELSEWAAFFASGSAKRQAAQAGIGRSISIREADDMVRQTGAFLDLVEAAIS
ncbi:SAV_6107 family HEPN domain-containing protein [Nakamurella endophytica]|uniref:SAV-6107-like HEPN domain-containing protein n=1 Tax=Nakamurella endophytica TaxID=1748367 RepID=A0A917T8D7_9ACTN|nr:SAV_6107 family HEPN domain-containing protein [Nakamurella endophytica]GGM11429.1 hypothetical protein GCM10011594_34210 [Nakamurella endophytica]